MSECTCRLRADECTGTSGIYHPLQDGGQCAIQDCEKQVTTDNSATLIAALAMIDKQTETINSARAEIERLTAQCEGWRQGQKEDLALQVELHKENQRLKSELADAEATVELSGAECERHIQEVDASREAIERKDAEIERLKADRAIAERNENAAMVAIDRKDAALRVALGVLSVQPQVKHIVDAITTIKEALK